MLSPEQQVEVRRWLDRILASKEFSRSLRYSRLLKRCVEESISGNLGALKESVLATELYQDNNYDSQQDSRVRVDMFQVRAKLRAYYESEGTQDPVRIEIPIGAYAAEFHWRAKARGKPSRSKARQWLVAGFASLVVLGWYSIRDTKIPTPTLPVQLTHDSGFTGEPAPARDGSLFVFSSDRGPDGAVHIWLRKGDEPPRQLTFGAWNDFNPTLSADLQWVAYRSNRTGADGIYVAPLGGGEARLIGSGGYAPRFSPTGHRVAFAAAGPDSNPHAYVVDLDSKEPQRQIDYGVNNASCPIWTPEGEYLLFVAQDAAEDWDYWLSRVDGTPNQSARRVELNRALRKLSYPPLIENNECPQDWHDGRLIFRVRPRDRSHGILMEVRLNGPDWRLSDIKVAQPFIDSDFFRVASARRRIYYSAERNTRAMWFLEQSRTRGAGFERIVEDVTIQGGMRGTHPGLAHDGSHLCFVTERTGRPDILCREASGGQARLLGATAERLSVVLPDRIGQRVAYFRGEEGRRELVIRRLSDGLEGKILDACQAVLQWVRHEDALVCRDANPPHGNLLRMVWIDSQHHKLVLRTERELMHAQISPDGRWVAFSINAGRDGLIAGYVVPLDGLSSDSTRWIKITDERFQLSLHWAPDGNSLFYWKSREGFRCLWRQSLDPVTRQPVGEPIAALHRHGYQAYPISGSELEVGGEPARFWVAMNLSDRLSNIWCLDVM